MKRIIRHRLLTVLRPARAPELHSVQGCDATLNVRDKLELRALPQELIVDILHHVYYLTRWHDMCSPALCQVQYLSLLLVCREWYLAGRPLLYTEPHLSSPRALTLFSRTMMRQPQLADRVRTLVISMDDNVLDRNSVRRMQALKLVGGERFYRMRTEQSTIHALHAILQACKNVETLCIPYLRNTSPTPRPAEGLPRNLVRLRRLTVYRWRWDGNSTFMPSDHGLTSISTTTVLDLNRQSLEELNLDHALVNFSLPAFPALRILRLTHTMIVGLDLLKEALSSKSQGGLEVIEFRNHWGSLSFSSPLEICGAIIQPNTRTLKELVLVGLDEMKLARTLDFEAFKVLHRLSIGYLARDEDPFEIVKVPHRVRVLDVHWEEMVESASRRVAYFFRTLELMEMYIVRDAYIQTSRQDGAQLSVQVVGQAPPRLRRLCSDWNIPVLEDEPEEFKGSDIGLRKDATLPQGPMHTLRVTFPSEMKIPWVEVG